MFCIVDTFQIVYLTFKVQFHLKYERMKVLISNIPVCLHRHFFDIN